MAWGNNSQIRKPVLDQNLKVTEQSAKDGDTMSLWQKLIKSDYVRDIAEHPEKTYTTRLRNKGKIYDFAAVARQDAAGFPGIWKSFRLPV